MGIRLRGTIAGLLALTATMLAADAADAAKPIKAEIARTKYGIPHIKANNIKSLAGGYAYAFAEDNTARSPRST